MLSLLLYLQFLLFLYVPRLGVVVVALATAKGTRKNNANVNVSPISVPIPEASTVSPPRLTQDLVDLADLRYDEWMVSESGGDEKTEENENVPSRYAFRMATAEIASERSAEGASVFLARRETTSAAAAATTTTSTTIRPVVGSAEASPIEFEGAVATKPATTDVAATNHNKERRWLWYVTDVVVSSNFRKQGIGKRLMKGLEGWVIDHAQQQQQQQQTHHTATSAGNGLCVENCDDSDAATTTTTIAELYLHVKEGNKAALALYEGLGYSRRSLEQQETPTSHGNNRKNNYDLFFTIDPNKLAENAGTTGQILLTKVLDCNASRNEATVEEEENAEETTGTTGGGFGMGARKQGKPKKTRNNNKSRRKKR